MQTQLPESRIEDENHFNFDEWLDAEMSHRGLSHIDFSESDLPDRNEADDNLDFAYAKLKEKDSIRILTLHPAKMFTDPIICTMAEHQLGDECRPQYIALSYVWGISATKYAITINGCQSTVGWSLLCAFHHIRNPYSETILWIDALCINQKDDVEKTHQVIQMRDIFSKAYGVFAWLGPHDKSSVVAFSIIEEMRKIPKAKCECEGKLHFFCAYQWPEKDSAPYKGYAQVLYRLLARPYWRRVWVMQEMLLPENLAFVCGNLLVPSETMTQIIWDICVQRQVQVPVDDKGFDIGHHITQLLQLRDFYRLKGARPDLQQLLFSSKDALATDPRDKIYGVLGLRDIGAPEINIVPDYELSACRVYCTAIRVIHMELADKAVRQMALKKWSEIHCLHDPFIENYAGNEDCDGVECGIQDTCFGILVHGVGLEKATNSS